MSTKALNYCVFAGVSIISMFTSCRNDVAITTTVSTMEAGGKNSDADGQGDENKTVDSTNHSFSLEIKSIKTSQAAFDVAKFLIIPDRSQSMANDLSDLMRSLPSLFKNFEANSKSFETRIIPMDYFLGYIHLSGGAYYPFGQSPSSTPNFSRVGAPGHWASIKAFGAESGAAPLVDALSQLATSGQSVNNETGLCAATDYLNWLQAQDNSNSLKFNSQDQLNFIFASDENNSASIENRDPIDNKLISQIPLYCYANGRSNQICQEQRYDNRYSFDSWCYSYQTMGTTIRHSGTATIRGICAAQTNDAVSTEVQLEGLNADTYCATNAYKCYRDNIVKTYQCSLRGNTLSFSADKSNQQQCKQFTSYTCQNQTPNYICSAPSSPVQHTITTPTFSSRSCNVAQTFNCQRYVDGVYQSVVHNRAEAVDFVKKGGQCTVASDSTYARMDIVIGSNEPGIQSCENYTCSANFLPADKNRTDAIAIMNNGGSCTPKGSFTYQDYQSSISAEQNYLTDCAEYKDCTELTTSTTTTFSSVIESQRSQYTRCDSTPTNTFFNPSRNISVSLNTSNHNSLNTINKATCGTGYTEKKGPVYKVSNAQLLCPANIPSTLPAGVTRSTVAEKSPATRTGVPFSMNYSTTQTAAQIENAINTSLTRATIEAISRDTVPTGQITNFSGNNSCYNFRRFPESDPTDPIRQTAQNFQETFLKIENRIDDGSFLIPPAANINSKFQFVKTEEFGPNGRYSKPTPSCTNQTQTETLVASNPEDVLDYLKKAFPSISMTFHAVVYNPKECGATPNAGASEGKAYIELANRTGGVVGSICANNFDGFFEKLSKNVLEQVVSNYDIPAEYHGKEIIRVVNNTNGTVYRNGIDYHLQPKTIFIDARAVREGDKITIWVKE